MIMVEFIVLNLYQEVSSLNSELETGGYWKYWRYFGRETTQMLHGGYCSGVKTSLLGYYFSKAEIVVVLEYLFKIRYSCRCFGYISKNTTTVIPKLRDYFCAASNLRRQSIFTFPPGIVSKQVFSLQKCGRLVMMQSKQNSSGGYTDEGRLGTPAQRPIAKDFQFLICVTTFLKRFSVFNLCVLGF
jgi:hypothetical protein